MMAPATCVVATTINGDKKSGENVPPHDAEAAGAQRPPGPDIVLGRFNLGRGPCRAGEIWPFGHADDEDEQRHGETT